MNKHGEMRIVLYPADDLLENFSCFVLWQLAAADYEVKQLAAVSVLHNHEKFLVSLDDLIFSVVEREWCGGDLPHRVGLRWGGELSLEF